VITTGDALARTGRLDTDLRPEVVIRFGAAPTSKALNGWLAARPEIPQILIDDAGWRDPAARSTRLVRADAALFASALADVVESAPASWAAAWAKADSAATQALIENVPFPSEPAIAAVLAAAIPGDTTLYGGSSMPIRDIDSFFPSTSKQVKIMSNRGANGIDGLISSGLGAAAAGGPVIILSGDLSLLHDLAALGTVARFGLPVTIVVVNNDGGGIFHFLPQAAYPEHFERLLGTPHGTDFQAIAAAFGIDHHHVVDSDTFHTLIATPATGPRLIEIRTDRVENVAIHEAAWRAVLELGRHH
jgi:2-succinyl-5-enolpyruvyl-6-hydroxy-3-cyclohexene-1-carboxylate synthase